MPDQLSTGRGGARTGAGRKPGRVSWKQVRLEAALHERLALIAAARGVTLTALCSKLLEHGLSVPDTSV